jgi:4-deoxy-L-threo-5-hexosulose-uronate ketol-isomerase
MHLLPDSVRSRTLSSQELREAFLVQDLFKPDTITLKHIDLDRVVLGGAVPCCDTLKLEAPESFKAGFFTERRELGILSIGGPGVVTVDGKRFTMEKRDVLYVGRGSRDIAFESLPNKDNPAKFYLISYPAHSDSPTTLVAAKDVTGNPIGSAETANARRIAKYIHADGAQSAQLVMGVTQLEKGSVWNTMPAHTHFRRTEIYLYFDIPDDAFVLHLMGEPTETRHLVVRNEEVVLSPPWSIHSGCGTANYTFCWAMGGENKDYTDMQPVGMKEIR